MWRRRFRRFLIANSNRERRRLWVVLMYSGLSGWMILSLMMGLPSLEGVVSGRTSYAIFFAFAALGAFGFLITASTSTHVVHGLKVDATPEAVWDRATRKAYQAILGVLLVVTGYWLFVWPLLRLPEAEVFPLFSLAFFCLVLSLPNAIIAWTEPEGDTL